MPVTCWGQSGPEPQRGCVAAGLLCLLMLCCAPAKLAAQEQEPAPAPSAEPAEPAPAQPEEQRLPDAPDAPNLRASTSIYGVVVDRSGAVISGCRIVLELTTHALQRTAVSAADGTYGFRDIPTGPFVLMTSHDGYVTRSASATLLEGESLEMPQTVLPFRGSEVDVQVYASVHEMAIEQVRLEEKQRVLGIFPNFYISYMPDAAPLDARQKFSLAVRSTVDPVNLALTGAVAGFEQAGNDFPGYGQGASGFGKRYGASFADGAVTTLIGGAMLPVAFRQDPRYFWKGTGTKAARARYAMTRIFICKGDNGRWQPNYSNILGNLAGAGISNLYYPASDRNGAGLTISNALIGTASGALANLYQEFFSRRMTPSAAKSPMPAPLR